VPVDDETIKRWVTDWCAKRKRPKFVLGIMEPDTTSVKTVTDAIRRIEKHFPAGKRVTIFVQDA
jgi:hypothetical protein